MSAGGEGLETELKFLCRPERMDAVLAAAPAGRDETRELISVYFDTAQHDLRKAGASLRIRESGGRRIQTLKRGHGVVREEFETEIEGLAPDPALPPLPELLPELLPGADGPTLRPCFHVRVTRRQRVVRHRGAEIELALDQGEVQAGAASRPISEVELELKSGPPAALFALARKLGKAASLSLSFESKAGRGQALLAGGTKTRAPWPNLNPKATTAQAFRTLAGSLLAQITVGAAALQGEPDAEGVHRLRVSLRRLRSTLSTYRPLFADETSRDLGERLRAVTRALDRTRNLDVFAETFVAPATDRQTSLRGLSALRTAVAQARDKAAAMATRAVRGAKFEALMLDVLEWIELGDLDPEVASEPAADFAAGALGDRFRKLRRRAKGLAGLSDTERHAVRIEAKKLRYAVEATQSLFPGRPADKFIRRLKSLQDELGALNDAAGVKPMIASLGLGPDAAFAAGALAGQAAGAGGDRLKAAARALAALQRAKRFWKT